MQTSRRTSIAFWTLLGVVLILLSYGITVALALGCVALVYTGNVVLAIGGVILGLTILWSLIPRREKFEAPGPTPGQCHFERGNVSVDPFALIADLAIGASNREAWLTRTATMGIAASLLAPGTATATA